MITLSQKLKKNNEQNNRRTNYESPPKQLKSRISIRDRLLPKEIQEVQSLLPCGASVTFPNHDNLHEFTIHLSPSEGYYKDGVFQFSVIVPEEYNMVPPTVKCLTNLWHPNINENGDICLSLLRPYSLDGSGWSPTRKLKDVVWGLDSLFTDLLNFDDPLNNEAAQMYQNDKLAFQNQVSKFIERHCPKKNA